MEFQVVTEVTKVVVTFTPAEADWLRRLIVKTVDDNESDLSGFDLDMCDRIELGLGR